MHAATMPVPVLRTSGSATRYPQVGHVQTGHVLTGTVPRL
uniref:Uncharacterized protein n=1 Tax=Nitratidesulfovibrio vulgaris (strain DSM 19637 / Miyazaki F) TaxID=883 RepID=B8DJU1_NITV9